MLIDTSSFFIANNFFSERPAMAHLRFVGRFVEMYSAQSFPVCPVAPKTMRSYNLGRESDIPEQTEYDD